MKTKPALLVVSLVLLSGCKDQAATTPPAAAPAAPAAAAPTPVAAAPTAEDLKAAAEMFSMRCLPCHGAGGAGDGPASAGLTPKPANFTLPEFQARVTDDHLEKVILYGGQAVGKSAAMPPNPDLESKPGILKGLRAHIRGLKK